MLFMPILIFYNNVQLKWRSVVSAFPPLGQRREVHIMLYSTTFQTLNITTEIKNKFQDILRDKKHKLNIC